MEKKLGRDIQDGNYNYKAFNDGEEEKHTSVTPDEP